MKTLAKAAFFTVLMLIFTGAVNAQVENILKNALPILYGDLAITPDKKYDKKDKQVYRDLFYDLDKAEQDITAYEIGALTEETVQIFDYKELKKMGKDEQKIDSLKSIIKTKKTEINDFMKWDEKWAADSLGIAMPFVSFQDNLKAKKYDEAYVFWRVLFEKFPLFHGTIYSGGNVLLKHKIGNAKDSTEKEAYIDTLFMMYDQQIRVYPKKEAYVLGRKTVDYYNFYLKKQDLNDSLVRLKLHINFELANKAIEVGGDKTAYYVFPTAMKLTYFEYLLKTIEAEQALDNYLYYSEVLNAQYEAQEDTKKKEKIKKGGIDPVDMIFTGSDLSTCENLVPTFQKKYDANPEDPKNLKKILTTLGQKGCTDSALYSEVAVALYDLDPTADYAHNLGMLFAQKEDYDKSIQYFDEAIEKEVVDTVKGEYYFEAAKVYNKQNKYSKAREYAREAIKLKPNCGKAYILIATMYAATANSVGTEAFEHQAVYWVAVDKLVQARNADPSVSETANSLIGSYSSRYPNKEEGFMRQVYEGNSYTVGGWIGEVTSARYNN